jgi:hypothetical protein
MLVSLSDQVSECLRHAEDCVQQAALQTNPELRQDYLIIAACWLKLSSELSDRLVNFSNSKNASGTAPAQAATPAATGSPHH